MKLKTKFQDEHFELGEVVYCTISYGLGDKIEVMAAGKNPVTYRYNSIKDFTDHWEDVPEEPKDSALNLTILTLTNFIENEPDEDKVDLEDCKQMLDKLKAWKRLKEKGYEFTGWDRHPDYPGDYRITASDEWACDDKDLDLLFGGEE